MARSNPVFAKLTVGERIRWLIEHRGYKQQELADKIGVTQAAISNLVTDNSRKPNAFTLIEMSDALDANPRWILYGEGDFERWPPPDRPDEAALLRKYRSMTEQQRHGLFELLAIKL